MIKILFFSLIISVSVLARLNPFEPIEVPVEQNSLETLQPIPVSNVRSEDDGSRTVKIISNEKVKKTIPKVIIKEKIIKEKLTKKELIEECKLLDKNKTKIIKPLSKPKPKFVAKTYKLLPFLTIDTKKRSVVIKTRKKYKLIKYIHLPKKKKIVFDFKGKVISSTKYRKIHSNPYFESFKIGNHKDKGFFRVVVKTKKATKKYSIIVKDGMVTLKY